jgi:hypothetical protein
VKAQLHVNVPAELYAAFRFAAEAKGETVTSVVVNLMRTYVGHVNKADMLKRIEAEQKLLDALRTQLTGA